MTRHDARSDSPTLGLALRDEYGLQMRPGTGESEVRRHHRQRQRHHHHPPPAPPHDRDADHHRRHHQHHRPRHRPHHAPPVAAVAVPGRRPPARTAKQDLMAYLNRPLPPPPPPHRAAYAQPRTAPAPPAVPPHHPWASATPFENPRAAPPVPGPGGRAFVAVSPRGAEGGEGKEDEPARGRPRAPRQRQRQSRPPPVAPRSAPVSPGVRSHWSDDSSDEEPREQREPRPGGGGRAVRRAVRRASESMAGAVRRVGSFASRASSRSGSRHVFGSRRGSGSRRPGSPASSSPTSSPSAAAAPPAPRRRSSATDRTRALLAAVRDRLGGAGARAPQYGGDYY